MAAGQLTALLGFLPSARRLAKSIGSTDLFGRRLLRVRYLRLRRPRGVRDYLNRLEVDSTQQVLDPFCGTGTTLVECKKLGIPSVGIERNPLAWFASRTKVNWSVDPQALLAHARQVANRTFKQLDREGIADPGPQPLSRSGVRRIDELRTLPPSRLDLLLKNSISPLPLHKALLLIETLEQHNNETVHDHERLALAAALTSGISNLHFGPEVGVGKIREDASVIGPWLDGSVPLPVEIRMA